MPRKAGEGSVAMDGQTKFSIKKINSTLKHGFEFRALLLDYFSAKARELSLPSDSTNNWMKMLSEYKRFWPEFECGMPFPLILYHVSPQIPSVYFFI